MAKRVPRRASDTLEKLLFAEHHFSHAASAFYPSPFEEAAVLTTLGTQTYLVNIEHDQIGRREHVDNAHWCAKETFESL